MLLIPIPVSVRRFVLPATAAAFLALSATDAAAVPAYAMQTGQACVACHIGAYGPQLTPFGRQFKLEGYTMRASDNFTSPLSATAAFSYVHTQKDLPEPPADHYGLNDNGGLDEASLFLAGGYGHFGGFVQGTFEGVDRNVVLDMVDLRTADHFDVSGNDVLLGASLTNMPAMQDVWNTLPVWGFPFTMSDLTPSPDASTILDGGLAMNVLGLTAYAYINSSIYLEAGAYFDPGHPYLRATGGNVMMGPGGVAGAAPYFRVAYEKDMGDQNFEVGAFGLFPDVHPNNMMGMGMGTTVTDSYKDYGFDASYQYTGTGDNTYTANMRYTHENQDLAGSVILGNAMHDNTLNDLRFDASYYWHNTYGGSVGFFDTWGSADPMLYADNRTFKPNSTGFIFQVDATLFGRDAASADPRFNVRVGMQYIAYTRFNGASDNFDGLGRDAADNNTFRIFTLIAL